MNAPIARPRNANQLLNAVKKVIREEPARIKMTHILVTNRCAIDSFVAGNCWTHEKVPECGTVGCIGGWAWTLTRRENTTPYEEDLGDVGAKLFGANSDLTDHKLGGLAEATTDDKYSVDLSHLFYHDYPEGKSGTPEYAEAVIANIERFQKKWRSRLVAHKVRVHQ